VKNDEQFWLITSDLATLQFTARICYLNFSNKILLLRGSAASASKPTIPGRCSEKGGGISM
jgi:hypothetical protein